MGLWAKDLGGAMRLISFAVFIISFFLFFTPKAQAAAFCSEVYRQPEMDYSDPLIEILENTTLELSQATTTKEANEHIHSLVVLANKIVDSIIENVLTINNSPLPDVVKYDMAKMPQASLKRLQDTFEIGDKDLSTLMETRMDKTIKELEKNYEDRTNKKAAGFERNESPKQAREASEDAYEPGFVRLKENLDPVEFLEDLTIGFDLGQGRIEAGAGKQPLGFVHFKERGEKSAPLEKDSAGFVHFEGARESEPINFVGIDLETGYFFQVKKVP